MPNLHNIFINYDRSISLTLSRQKRLTSAKISVENAIKSHFRNDMRIVVPHFYIQGSYKMKTMIVKKDNTYDVDLGVYFLNKPNMEAISLQKNVFNAVRYKTNSGATHKEKCIRVNYQGEFNIDLPVYYLDKNSNTSYLATKYGWEISDPKDLVEWYFDNGGKSPQLRRIIKYLKAWANNHKNKFPSGIALSVWATNKYSPHKRDDIALYNTLLGIKTYLFWNGIYCENPAPPKDDLVAKLTSTQQSRFKSELKILIDDLDNAIEIPNLKQAVNILRTHFGKRYK